MTAPASSIYLDTSALVRMVECDVSNPTSRNQHAGGPVTQLCAGPTPQVGLSSLTIVEFHNTLAANWRDTQSTSVEYDQTWVERSQIKVMKLLAENRLILRTVPARADEHAIALVTLATRDHGNGLRVWDAIHLITAAAWARELQATVELWTTDTDFGRFVHLFPQFKQFVQIRNLDD